MSKSTNARTSPGTNFNSVSKMPKLLFFIIVILASSSIVGQAAAAFVLPTSSRKVLLGKNTIRPDPPGTATSLALRPRRRNPNNRDESFRSEGDEMPQLPAFRGYRAPTSNNDENNASSGEASAAAFVNSKLELQYTCKVCETRNHHKVSRIAYNKGVVIATCKGCLSQHVISDNLGFTQKLDGNLEDYFKGQGSEESVARVNEDVFHLERILGVDTNGGFIHGPDGERHLE